MPAKIMSDDAEALGVVANVTARREGAPKGPRFRPKRLNTAGLADLIGQVVAGRPGKYQRMKSSWAG